MVPPVPHRKTIKHYDLPGDARHLTFSCYHHLPLLSKERTCRWLVDAIASARIQHGFDLWAWVIMPEHVHLLIYPREKVDMRRVLPSIKNPVAVRAIQWLWRRAPHFLQKIRVTVGGKVKHRFWQAGPGFDQNFDDVRAIHEVIEYIHMNPVRRGLVMRPEDWKWSSARAWMGLPSVLNVDRSVPRLVL